MCNISERTVWDRWVRGVRGKELLMPVRQIIEEEGVQFGVRIRVDAAEELRELGGNIQSASVRAAVEYALLERDKFIEFLSRYQLETVTPNKQRCREIYEEAMKWHASHAKKS